MSNISGEEGSFSSGNTGEESHKLHTSNNNISSVTASNGSSSQSQLHQNKPPAKKKRNLPGNPDPNAEVIALSPTTLMATNRFVCEICNKGFQRDQNLQLHRRGHNLPWKLRQRTTTEVRKRVYICPEPTCVHHNPARALGDLTGIKKHYSRKHGEKKWKCDKCSKKYAVQSDWKAHQKTCGTREYKCDCGTIFSRRDSFITHRAFCDALAEENNKVNQGLMNNMEPQLSGQMNDLMSSNASLGLSEFNNFDPKNPLKSLPQELLPIPFKSMNNNVAQGGMFSTPSGNLFGSPRSVASSSSGLQLSSNIPSNFNYLQDSGKNGSAQGQGQLSGSTAPMSATALLQKAAQMGATASSSINSPMMQKSFVTSAMAGPDTITRPTPYVGPSPYENFQTQADNNNHHQPNFAAVMSDMGIYSGILMNENNGVFVKNVTEHDHENNNTNNSSTGRNVMGMRNQTVLGQNGNDMLTVDFLGVGGTSRPPISLHEQQQQKRMQAAAINPFHQQNVNLHGNEKPIWDV
ncbi:zinc finger protein GAI-ASSOCIATED FACTOR 1-like [Lycium ferocissimum]|uniref:zinc finger protein GAI-ASSOCIATED FACTOR 1-like n=1 Tax=Lycium ferocissimum TaxID=112874 RepID=UPI002814A834|nr:zinc finger protein GAI-ASSOCIATED FACTOR 1-like [Lycium ferocissimum]